MLCTKCSTRVTPLVAIDIDGTLGDYHGHFLSFAANYLGFNRLVPRRYGGSPRFRIWCQDTFGIDERAYNDLKLAYRQGGMKRSMPIFSGARDLITVIRATGAEVWLTTTRPYLRLDGVDPDTRHWLERHGIEYDGLLYDEDKYQVLADRVDRARVVAVLDDLIEQYDAAARVFGMTVPILARNPYNFELHRPAVLDLNNARVEIQERVYRWDRNVG